MEEKRIFTEDDFDFATAKIGDWVNNQVVDNVINCLPPACMRESCTQMGEPYSHQYHPITGTLHPVFATFKRVTAEAWEFCGYCFRGENVPCGKEPYYVGGDRR